LTPRIHKNLRYVATLNNLLSALKRVKVEAIHSPEDSRNLFRPRRAWRDVINLRLFACISLKAQMLVAMSVSL